MTRTYLMLAAVGLATAACGGGGESEKAAATGGAGTGGQAGGAETADAPVEAPDLLPATATGPDGVVPGGAVDVMRREGWRVEGQPAAAQPAPTATETPR